MSDERDNEGGESGAKPARTKDQVPAHIPPQLRELFTKHPGAVAARPGFRNPPNGKSKAQKGDGKRKP